MNDLFCYDCQFNALGRPCRDGSGRRDFDAMADAYIRYWNARMQEEAPAAAEDWISDCVFELERSDPRGTLVFIVFALERVRSAQMLAVHAAGPLENVLAGFGPEIIETLEDMARRSAKFRLLLSGMWGANRIKPEIWRRICAAVAAGPVFCEDFHTPGHQNGLQQASDAEIGALLATSVIADLGGRASVEALVTPGIAPA